MKKIYFFFILSFVASASSKAQIYQYFEMQSPDSIVCSSNASVLNKGFQDWEAYQTLDSTWYGPQDTTCISFRYRSHQGYNYPSINFNQIDRTKPVYIRYKFTDSTAFALDTNDVYSMSFYMPDFRAGILELSNTCKDNICSGLIMDIRIPDSAGTGYNYRNYTAPLSQSNFSQNEICFSTEKFLNENFLRNLIFKITPTASSLASDTVNLPAFSLMSSNFNSPLNEIRDSLVAYSTGNHHWDTFYNNLGDNLVMYTAPGYPSANNQSFIEIHPSVNPATVDTIDLQMSLFTRIHFQPFANLLPSHIAGSTTQRHVLNIIDQGSFMCLAYVDLIVSQGSNFIYRSGDIKFNAPRSCLMFIDGGKLIVDENATLNYGTEHRGMLGLIRNSGIELRKNSSLNIYNTVMLAEGSGATESQQFYMNLPASTTLRFMPGSHVSNQFSINEQRKLNVFMKGGILDDSGLDEDSKKLINRIYDTPSGNLNDDVVIYSNPVHDNFLFSIVNKDAAEITFSVYDINGKLHVNKTQKCFEGINYYNQNISELPAGAYFLNVQLEGKHSGKMFIKQ